MCRHCIHKTVLEAIGFLVCIAIVLLNVSCSTSNSRDSKSEDPLDNFVDWSIYRGDKRGLQWSELDQIDRYNVQRLSVAWEYRHGKPSGPSMYSNPIIVDGLLYFVSPTLDAICIDARSGEEVSPSGSRLGGVLDGVVRRIVHVRSSRVGVNRHTGRRPNSKWCGNRFPAPLASRHSKRSSTCLVPRRPSVVRVDWAFG